MNAALIALPYTAVGFQLLLGLFLCIYFTLKKAQIFIPLPFVI